MKLRELTDFLESIAPLGLQESYDNSGLQLGNRDMEIKGVMVALDVTEAIIAEAIGRGCNVVVAHHPLIFKGLKRLTGASGVERTVMMAMKHDIALWVMHTNFDNAAEGLNFHLARKLGVQKPQVLLPIENSFHKVVTFCPTGAADAVRMAMFAAGGGRIGHYDRCSFNAEGSGTYRPLEGSEPYFGAWNEFHTGTEVRVEMVVPQYLSARVVEAMKQAHPYEEVAFDVIPLVNSNPYTGAGAWGELETPMSPEEFLASVKYSLDAGGIRYSPGRGSEVRRIGVCGGSGSFLFEQSIRLGLDALVTSDLKYHLFAEEGINILLIDAGHYETEVIMTSIISEAIQKKFTNFACHISGQQKNPISYHK